MTGYFQCFRFRLEQRRVEHYTVTDDIHLITLEDSPKEWNGAHISDLQTQCMTGVQAALKTMPLHRISG